MTAKEATEVLQYFHKHGLHPDHAPPWKVSQARKLLSQSSQDVMILQSIINRKK